MKQQNDIIDKNDCRNQPIINGHVCLTFNEVGVFLDEYVATDGYRREHKR